MPEDVGSLAVSLSLDSSDFNRPLASVDRNLKALGGELSAIRNKGKEWGDSLEGLRTKQDTLGRTLTAQESKVKSLREAYEKSKAEKGEDAAATEQLAVKLNRAVAEYTRTETEIGQVNASLAEQQEELRRAESNWGRLESSLDSASERLDAAGEKMKGTGEKLTLGVTAPLVGLGLAAFKSADDFDVAQGQIQAQLGITEDRAKELTDISKELWEDAYGDSVLQAGENVASVNQNMRNMSDKELKSVTAAAMDMEKVFKVGVNETTSAAGVIMENFGDSGTKAMDLLTRGMQIAGPRGEDLLDTFKEYSPQFKALGMSSEESMNLLLQGLQAGARNTDVLADSLKEFTIEAEQSGERVADGYERIGLDGGKMMKNIAEGGEKANEAFFATITALAGMEDATQRNAAGVEIFGTKWEDVKGSALLALDPTIDLLGEVEGAAKKAGDAANNNFGTRMTTAFREFQADLEPAGEILVDLAEDVLPKVAETIGNVTDAFADMSPEAQETALKIAGVAAAAGPALVVVGTLATGLGTLATAGKGIVSVLGKAGGAGLIGRIGLLGVSGPVGLAVAGVGLLGAGIYAVTKASEENTTESIKAIEAKQAEIAKNEELITSYEDLERKNRLSTDEMLRFLDIQAEMDSTTAPDAIAALKDEQAGLLEKSTLTNGEMVTFLEKNQEIIDKSDATKKAISEQGIAFAENTDALRELNAEKAKEMENDARELLAESLEREKSLLQEQKDLITGINEANTLQAEQKQIISDKARDIAAIEKEIKDLENDKKGASLEQSVALDQQISKKEQLLWQAGDEKARAEELLSTYGKQIGKKDEELDKNRQSLAQADAAKFKYEEIILAQAGITSEKGKGLEKIGEEIRKLEEQKGKQRELLSAGKINTAEYQTQIGKINTQIGKFEEAQGELRLMNDIAGKEIFKDINMRENPRGFASYLNTELGRQINKNVVLKYNNMNGPQQVGGFATGTRYAPGGLSWVGEEGPELMYVPQGARVIPTNDSEALLNKWNVPTGRNSSTVSSGNVSSGRMQPLQIAIQIPLDGRDLVERTIHITEEMLEKNRVLNAITRGETIF